MHTAYPAPSLSLHWLSGLPAAVQVQDQNICDEVTAAAVACIEEKGSFSLCIPGGSVVKALENLKARAGAAARAHPRAPARTSLEP